jgi:RHS repeat-associated protein
MRAATTNKVGPKTRATRRPPGQAHSHNKWTDRRGPVTTQTDNRLTVAYYANDVVQRINDSFVTWTYGLDANNRVLTTNGLDDDDDPLTITNDYADSSDSPAWTVDTNGTVIRYIHDPNNMAAVSIKYGQATYALTDPRGDNVLQINSSTTGINDPADGMSTYKGYTDFGNKDIRCWETECESDDVFYGNYYDYLGGLERTSTDVGGIILMGTRLYNPTTGRFLTPDPVQSGSANPYDYANQNPLNSADASGAAPTLWWAWNRGLNDLVYPLDWPGPTATGGLQSPYWDLNTAINNCLFDDITTCSSLSGAYQDIATLFMAQYGKSFSAAEQRKIFPDSQFQRNTSWSHGQSFSVCMVLCVQVGLSNDGHLDIGVTVGLSDPGVSIETYGQIGNGGGLYALTGCEMPGVDEELSTSGGFSGGVATGEEFSCDVGVGISLPL